MLHDLRYALRLIAKDRWFSAAAIVTLCSWDRRQRHRIHPRQRRPAAGALAARQPAGVRVVLAGRRRSKVPLSRPEFLEWRSQSRSFATSCRRDQRDGQHQRRPRLPERAQRALVLGDAFAVFGQQPHTGRGFTAADERQGAPAVVIISHQIWRTATPQIRRRSDRPCA